MSKNGVSNLKLVIIFLLLLPFILQINLSAQTSTYYRTFSGNSFGKALSPVEEISNGEAMFVGRKPNELILTKIDKDGFSVWRKSIKNENVFDYDNNVNYTSGGEILVTASLLKKNYFLSAFNSDGDSLWTKVLFR